MNIWLTILGMAVATYLTRAIPLLTLRGAINPEVERWMRYVPPAVFAALIIPNLFAPDGILFAPDGSLVAGAYLWAGLIGIAAAWFSRNMVITLAVGLAAFMLLRWLGVQ